MHLWGLSNVVENFPVKRRDLEFASDYDAAMKSGTPRAAMVSLLLCAALVAAALAWANWARVEEVTRGEGKVVPSSRTQLLQSLEGGIVKDILVRDGDRVKKGEVLVRIDDTGFASNFGELRAKQLAYQVQIARLVHESGPGPEQPLQLPPELLRDAPVVAAGELDLFNARRQSLATQIDVLNERVEQRQRELSEHAAAVDRLSNDLKLARDELAIKQPLAERGIVAKTDLIRLQRDVTGLEGQIRVEQESRSKLEAALREATGEVAEQRQKFQQDARNELAQKQAELSVIDESMKASKDRVVRADIRSPVDGIINKVNTNTIGGVVQAGQTLMEIVPIEDSLFVEAKIRPSDIAFVYPRQHAVVKITAYDFSIYGGLEGEVERISADSVYDESTRENYYLVTVKTLGNQLKGKQESLPIIPGMVASVDILTGEKSVLQYLLKPINKARYEALTER